VLGREAEGEREGEKKEGKGGKRRKKEERDKEGKGGKRRREKAYLPGKKGPLHPP
jgi:hypothetical protein